MQHLYRFLICFLLSAMHLVHAGPTQPTSALEKVPLSDLSQGDLIYLGKTPEEVACVVIYLDPAQAVVVKGPQDLACPLTITASDPLWSEYPHHTAHRIQAKIEKSLPILEGISQILTASSNPDGATCSFVNKEALPLVLTCENQQDYPLRQWVRAHQHKLHALLAKHGALLLRNFAVSSPEDFAWVVKKITGHEPSDYASGEGSRTKICKGVYTSTDAPPQYKISLHHELSCTEHPLKYLSFYCEIAPTAGTGQTLLGRTEEVTQAMQKRAVWNLFEGKKIKYISRHPPEGSCFCRVNPTHRTWQACFETEDREVVERICKEKGFSFQWLGDWIEVTRLAPATRGPDTFFSHPYWYNQAHLYHANPRGRGGRLNHYLANLLYVMPSTRQYDVCFEDDSTIPRSAVYQIYDAMDESTIHFDWQKGDILLLDNRKVLHGRSPCSSARRILAAMVRS